MAVSLKNTYKEISKILNFYNIEIDKKRLNEIILEEKFDNKKQRMEKINNQWMGSIMRKGGNGDGEYFFDKETMKLINDFGGLNENTIF